MDLIDWLSNEHNLSLVTALILGMFIGFSAAFLIVMLWLKKGFFGIKRVDENQFIRMSGTTHKHIWK